jgi:hypothetical protein
MRKAKFLSKDQKKTSKNFLYIFVQRSKKTSKNINALAAIIQSRFGALRGLAVRSFILISTKRVAFDCVTQWSRQAASIAPGFIVVSLVS